jgi:hypothetical protein
LPAFSSLKAIVWSLSLLLTAHQDAFPVGLPDVEILALDEIVHQFPAITCEVNIVGIVALFTIEPAEHPAESVIRFDMVVQVTSSE